MDLTVQLREIKAITVDDDVETPTPEERLRILPTLETPHSDSDRAAVNAAISNLFGNGNGDPFYKRSHEGRK